MDPATLSDCLVRFRSDTPEVRSMAESELLTASEDASFAVNLLLLVRDRNFPVTTRSDAAGRLVSHLEFDSRWASSEEEIKPLLLETFLTSEPNIQCKLAVAFGSICVFPLVWKELLPRLAIHLRLILHISGRHTPLSKFPVFRLYLGTSPLKERLDEKAESFLGVKGVLLAVDKIFVKARESPTIRSDIESCVKVFGGTLSNLIKKIEGYLRESNVRNSKGWHGLYSLIEECQSISFNILYSLNAIVGEDDFGISLLADRDWIRLLTVSMIRIEGCGFESDVLGSVIVQNLGFYIFKAAKYDPPGDIINRVKRALCDSSSSRLAKSALDFLLLISESSSLSHFLNNRGGFWRDIVSRVFKLLLVTEWDENQFAKFPKDYMDGVMSSNRECTLKILNRMFFHLNAKRASNILWNGGVTGLLDNKSDWKYKEGALFCITSLGRHLGCFDILIHPDKFFRSQILWEFEREEINPNPMLTASRLKFVKECCHIIEKQQLLAIFPRVIKLLNSESLVVTSYAALCIGKFLEKYTFSDLGYSYNSLLKNLHRVLQRSVDKNEFVIDFVLDCIRRVIEIADISSKIALYSIRILTEFFRNISLDRSASINKFKGGIFEIIWLLIGKVPFKITVIEEHLSPVIDFIFSNDVGEWSTFEIKLCQQLVDLTHVLYEYSSKFQDLLDLSKWKKSSDIPGLVSLLLAVLRRLPDDTMLYYINSKGFLEICSWLVLSDSADEQQGFNLLNSMMIQAGRYDVVQHLIKALWDVLVKGLEREHRDKYVGNLVMFISLFVVIFGADKFLDSTSYVNVEKGSSFTLVEQVWIPAVPEMTGSIEKKLTLVAATKLICAYLDIRKYGLAGKLLNSVLNLLSQAEMKRSVSPVAAFGKTEDPLKDIEDPTMYLVVSLKKSFGASPDDFYSMIEKLEEVNQAAFTNLCSAYEVTLL